jgi:hypothetical protein
MELFFILYTFEGGKSSETNDAVSCFLPPCFPQVQIQKGICSCYSWQINLLLLFAFLFLWSILLAILSSAAVLKNEHDMQSREQKLRQDRLDFVSKRVTVKVSMKAFVRPSRLPLCCSQPFLGRGFCGRLKGAGLIV